MSRTLLCRVSPRFSSTQLRMMTSGVLTFVDVSVCSWREDPGRNRIPKRSSSSIQGRHLCPLRRSSTSPLSFTTLPFTRLQLTSFLLCVLQPESVDITNVSKLFDADGKPHFKAVVEGANLFFTQQARLHLEKRGVIVFKDSSANKVCRRLLFSFWSLLSSRAAFCG